MSIEVLSNYAEGLKKLKEKAASISKEQKTGSLAEEIPDILQSTEHLEGSGVKETIKRFKFYLLEETSTLDKQQLVDIASHFVKDLTEYITTWHEYFQSSGAQSGLKSVDNLHLKSVIIVDIRDLFIHCKESTSIFEKCFIEVSTYLSNLFKSTYQTLKAILETLEKNNLEAGNEKEISEYAKCVMLVFEVSHILNGIDLMPFGNTLGCLNRIILNQKHLIHEKLDECRIFEIIASCIIDKVNFCWTLIEEAVFQDQVDSKRLSKVMKILRFLLGMLLQLLKIYSQQIHGNVAQGLIDILLRLQWMCPNSSHGRLLESLCYKEFYCSVLVANEPLLLEIIDKRGFAPRILHIEGLLNGEVNTTRLLSTLLLSLAISYHLASAKDETKDEWMIENEALSRRSLIDVTFLLHEKCLEQGLGSITVPSNVEVDNIPRNVPLHEFVCIRMCALAATFKQTNYSKMENCLLKHLVMTRFSYWLAGDIFSFIARWGPETLCHELTKFFANVSVNLFKQTSLESEKLNRCMAMMQRLFLLLGDSEKESFLSDVLSSGNDHVFLWMALPVSSLDEQSYAKYIPFVATTTLKNLEDLKATGNKNMMLLTLKVWENCLKREDAFEYLPRIQIQSLVDVVTEIFLNFKSSDPEEEIEEQFVCRLFGVASTMTCAMDQSRIKEVLQVALILLDCNASEILSHEICHFLISLKSMHFESEFKEKCLYCISRLFQSLLTHASFIIRYEAMRSLKAFAEVTVHSEVVQKCLPEELNHSFTSFLNNVRTLESMPSTEQEERLKKALDSSWSNKSQPVLKASIECLPASPVFDNGNEELNILVTNLERAVHGIKMYAEEKHVPESTLLRIKRAVEDALQL